MKSVRRLCVAAFLALCLTVPSAAQAASKDPVFTYAPQGESANPPPVGNLEAPCGLAVDSSGRFYVADRYHDAIDRISAAFVYADQRSAANPCALALGSAGELYANSYHGAVGRYSSFTANVATTIDPGPATGVATDPATGDVYVDDRDHVSVYEPSGAPVEVAGQPLQIGAPSLEKGYGIAVSGFPATEGFLYVPDAATETLEVYDPATDTEAPVATINGSQTPLGRFSSLTDSAVAVDDASGRVYVADDLQPEAADRPEAAIYVFSHTGAYEGRLKYNIVDARPPGLAVDNSGGGAQGRVYVTSGNTEKAAVVAYAPGSAGAEARLAPEAPEPLPPGGCACGVLPEPPPPLTCEGDSCQHLPSEPTDPTLNTLIEGAANPPVRFQDTNRLSHYLRLRHHRRRGRAGGPPAATPRSVYRGKTNQKQKIRLSVAPGQITLIRFKAKMLCRDGSLAYGDLSDFEATPLGRGGHFSDAQHGASDSVGWHGRLKARRVSGALRVKGRLKSGVRCDSGLVGFRAKRVR